MKRVIAAILLILAIAISYRGAYELLKERQDGGGTYQLECFYEQPKDSIDVLFVGSSRVFCNIEPSVLWDNYGISAYDLATNSQQIHLSYYAIKEAFKYQKPKVIVLEVSRRDHEESYEDEDQTMSFQNGMRFSTNKLEALFDLSDPENRMDYLLGLPCYHSRYREFNKEMFMEYDFDYMYPKHKKAAYKGGIELFNICGFDSFSEEMTVDEDEAIPKFTDAMDKIKDLCKANGAELLLVNTPHINRTEFKCVLDYATKNNLTYVNLNNVLDEVGIVPYEDFADEGHLNYLGSSKVAAYLGEYLYKNYDLIDHRGVEKYASWDENSEYVKFLYEDAKLRYVTGLGEYMNNCLKDNYMLVVSLVGNYNEFSMGQKDALLGIGCSESAYEIGGTFVLNDGKITCYIPTGENADISEKIGHRRFGIHKNATDRKITFDGIDYSLHYDDGSLIENGIEIIVYDKRSQKVADAVCFDSVDNFSIKRMKLPDTQK